MIHLSETTKTLIDKLRPKESDFIPTKSKLPPWPTLEQRRFMLCKGIGTHPRVTLIWIDDEDSCTRDQGDFLNCHARGDGGFVVPKDWHSYTALSEFKKENVYGIRCPASLTFEERRRVEADIPIGHVDSRLRAVREESRRPGKGRSAPELTDDETPF